MHRVDIFILSFNRQDYIIESIDSLYQQTFDGYDLYVLDNCSTDSTIEKIKKYHPEVKIIPSVENLGFLENFKRIYDYAKADWVMAFHDDDLIHKDYLAKAFELINKNRNVSLVASNFSGFENLSIKELNKETLDSEFIIFENQSSFANFCMTDNKIGFSSCLYKREFLNKISFDLTKYGKMLDRPLMIENCGTGKTLVFKSYYLRYRVHQKQDSQDPSNGPFLEEGKNLINYYKKISIKGAFKNKLSFAISVNSFIKEVYKWCSDRNSTTYLSYKIILFRSIGLPVSVFLPRPITRWLKKFIKLTYKSFY